MWYVFFLTFFYSLSSWALVLNAHSWQTTDISEKRISLDHLERTLKTNWDREASSEDLAHLYAYQIWKKSQIKTAKAFLLSNSTKAIVSTLVSDAHHLYAFDHQAKKFMHFEDWKQKYSPVHCEELVRPTDEIIFKIQIRHLQLQDQCLYMIVPAHFYEQLELYPSSTPKDFSESDIVQACYQATDRKLFRKDEKRCRSWMRNL